MSGMAVFLSYLPYALVTAFTPGPNNLLSFYAVSRSGWRGGKGVLLGIAAGFFVVAELCAAFCWELARLAPAIAGVLKYVGAVYIVWLAVHVARGGSSEERDARASFWRGFFLQFANGKIILYAVTVYTGYVLPNRTGLAPLLAHGAVLVLIALASCCTWAAAGGALQDFLRAHDRPFRLCMGAVLLWCAWSLAFGS